MVRPLRSIAGIVLALAISVGFATGCGGGGGGGEGGPDRAQGLTPAQLLAQSSDALAAAHSFRIGLEAAGDISLTNPPSGPAALLNGPLELSGEGPVEPPDKASIDISLKVAGLPLQVNLTRVGGEVFLGALGQDFKIALPPEQVALLDLRGALPDPRRLDQRPRGRRAREHRRNRHRRRSRARWTPRRRLADLGPLLGAEPSAPPTPRRPCAPAPSSSGSGRRTCCRGASIWCSRATGPASARAVGPVNIDLTADLSAFGEPVDITAPTGAKDLDLNDLGSLVGG